MGFCVGQEAREREEEHEGPPAIHISPSTVLDLLRVQEGEGKEGGKEGGEEKGEGEGKEGAGEAAGEGKQRVEPGEFLHDPGR
jgi:hypothetical protein